MAEIGVFAVPPWIIVYNLADEKPEVLGRVFARLNSASKSACCLGEPSVKTLP